MALFTMTNTQMRFPILHWFDGSVPPVEMFPTADQLKYDSTDETVAKWGMYKADGSPGDATDPGKMGLASGVDGACTVHVVATNPDKSTVTLTADYTVGSVVPPTANIRTGSIDFEAAIEKSAAASARAATMATRTR